MDKFSISVFNSLVSHFPDLGKNNNQETKHLEIDIPSPKDAYIGGLVIQTTEDKDIWLRNYHSYSAYAFDNTEQLITLIKGIFEDKILWVISSKDDEWCETTLVKSLEDLETEKGVVYKILSWSGTLDKTFTAD